MQKIKRGGGGNWIWLETMPEISHLAEKSNMAYC